MATQTFTQRSGRFLSWAHTESVAQGTTSVPVVVPPMMAGQRIYAKVTAGTNAAAVNFTISSDALVAAGTAKWEVWSDGSNAGTKSAVIPGPISGISCTTTTLNNNATVFDVLIG